MIYWHVLPADGKLRHSDGRDVRIGETLTIDGEVRVAEHGLHACTTIYGALREAWMSSIVDSFEFLLCKVELTETDDYICGWDGYSIVCSTSRTCLDMRICTPDDVMETTPLHTILRKDFTEAWYDALPVKEWEVVNPGGDLNFSEETGENHDTAASQS